MTNSISSEICQLKKYLLLNNINMVEYSRITGRNIDNKKRQNHFWFRLFLKSSM